MTFKKNHVLLIGREEDYLRDQELSENIDLKDKRQAQQDYKEIQDTSIGKILTITTIIFSLIIIFISLYSIYLLYHALRFITFSLGWIKSTVAKEVDPINSNEL